MKNLIIGLGTGRCGTQSLAAILNHQDDSFFTHEMLVSSNKRATAPLSWTADFKSLKNYLDIAYNRNYSFVGDISLYLLPHVESIVKIYPNVKFIVIKRDKEKTISSFLKKTSGRNHWMEHDGSIWKKDFVWDKCFPKFNTSSKESALEMYYDHYYNFASKIDNSIVFEIKTEDLNLEDKVLNMLKFCGFKKPIFKKVHTNKGKM